MQIELYIQMKAGFGGDLMPECSVTKMGHQLDCDKPLHGRWGGGVKMKIFLYVIFECSYCRRGSIFIPVTA